MGTIGACRPGHTQALPELFESCVLISQELDTKTPYIAYACLRMHRRMYSIQFIDKIRFPQLRIKCSVAKSCLGTHTCLWWEQGSLYWTHRNKTSSKTVMKLRPHNTTLYWAKLFPCCCHKCHLVATYFFGKCKRLITVTHPECKQLIHQTTWRWIIITCWYPVIILVMSRPSIILKLLTEKLWQN